MYIPDTFFPENVYVRTSRGSIVGVHDFFFCLRVTPGSIVLLLMYQRKVTIVYCVQPTRAAAGNRRRSSKKVIRTCCGISYIQLWRITNKSGGGRAAAGERRWVSEVCAHTKYSIRIVVRSIVRSCCTAVALYSCYTVVHQVHKHTVRSYQTLTQQ